AAGAEPADHEVAGAGTELRVDAGTVEALGAERRRAVRARTVGHDRAPAESFEVGEERVLPARHDREVIVVVVLRVAHDGPKRTRLPIEEIDLTGLLVAGDDAAAEAGIGDRDPIADNGKDGAAEAEPVGGQRI